MVRSFYVYLIFRVRPDSSNGDLRNEPENLIYSPKRDLNIAWLCSFLSDIVGTWHLEGSPENYKNEYRDEIRKAE